MCHPRLNAAYLCVRISLRAQWAHGLLQGGGSGGSGHEETARRVTHSLLGRPLPLGGAPYWMWWPFNDGAVAEA